MRKSRLVILAAAVVLIMALTLPAALGYFSTYVRIPGTKTVHLSDGDKMKEENVSGSKHVVITADEDSDPIFVRVKAFAPTDIEDKLVYEGKGWTKGADGWWYYDEPLSKGGSAAIDISLPDIEIDKATFNVVVLHEYVPAIPDGRGGLTADWTNPSLDVTKAEGGGN